MSPTQNARLAHRDSHRIPAPTTATQSRGLSFDGCGINGPDEYRSRIATFQRSLDSASVAKYGALFAAAPELLAACQEAREAIYETINRRPARLAHVFHEIDAAIRQATAGE